MGGKIDVASFAGAEFKSFNYTNVNVASYGNFNYPDFWSLDNPSDWPDWGNRGRIRGHNYGSKVLYSVLGSALISYNDEYYLEIQGRNDWSSTLPPENNSYFFAKYSSS